MFAAMNLWLLDSAMIHQAARAQRILSLPGHDAAHTQVRQDKLQDFVAKSGVIASYVPMLYKDERVVLALRNCLRILGAVFRALLL